MAPKKAQSTLPVAPAPKKSTSVKSTLTMAVVPPHFQAMDGYDRSTFLEQHAKHLENKHLFYTRQPGGSCTSGMSKCHLPPTLPTRCPRVAGAHCDAASGPITPGGELACAPPWLTIGASPTFFFGVESMGDSRRSHSRRRASQRYAAFIGSCRGSLAKCSRRARHARGAHKKPKFIA